MNMLSISLTSAGTPRVIIFLGHHITVCLKRLFVNRECATSFVYIFKVVSLLTGCRCDGCCLILLFFVTASILFWNVSYFFVMPLPFIANCMSQFDDLKLFILRLSWLLFHWQWCHNSFWLMAYRSVAVVCWYGL